jgi:hypothetical protein
MQQYMCKAMFRAVYVQLQPHCTAWYAQHACFLLDVCCCAMVDVLAVALVTAITPCCLIGCAVLETSLITLVSAAVSAAAAAAARS